MRLGLALMASCLLSLGGGQAASAATQATPPDTAQLKELPDLVLTPWLGSQTKNGNFKRPSGTLLTDGYANAGIGYAMLLEAVRSGDERYFESAMKAFRWVTRTRYPLDGVFYKMFSAAAYNVARENFASRMAFRRIRGAWSNQLRRMPFQRGVLGSYYRYNKNLVEALAVIELYRSGLRSRSRKSVVYDRREAIRRAVRLLNVQIPRAVKSYTVTVGTGEGWPFTTQVAQLSDPPDNPPAYNALSAGFYARAYERLPVDYRTERMRQTSERMIDGVIARAAPDGDIAFDGRSQEQAWALSSAAYASWNATDFETGQLRESHLAFSRRAVKRLEDVHVTSKSSFGFVLTPAAGCCDRQDNPPGQDHYYDVGKYSGLTAMTMGWAIADRPDDWESGNDTLPTDRDSDFIFRLGRGRFQQHRAGNIYWFLRMQSDFYDARADSGVAVMKIRDSAGNWIDALPPRPYTGGHHKPADPAAPCLVYRRGCAYLELRGGKAAGDGSYLYSVRWVTARGTRVRTSSARVTPTESGLRLRLAARAGDQFRVDTFLAQPGCLPGGGLAGLHVTMTITGQTSCTVDPEVFAGGSMINLRKTSLVGTPSDDAIDVTYSAFAS